MDISKFGQDSNLAENGVWVAISNNLELLVARSGNHKYNQTVRSLSKPYKRAIAAGTLADDKYEELATIAMAKALLLGWKGLERDGVEIPYSEGEALKILNDPNYRDFKELVSSLCEEQEVFKQVEVEEIVGESEVS